MSVDLTAVILAAGASQRYQDGNKLLAELGNRPMIRCVAEQVTQSAAGDVVVVTGNARTCIEAALDGLPLRFVHNESWRDGIGGSISLGISSVSAAAQGAFIVLGDMPFVGGELLNSLARTFDRAGGESIVFPVTSDGGQRNPVLWPRAYFSQLARLSGDEGAKSLLRLHASHCMAVAGFPETAFSDVDTRDDLDTVLFIGR